jgi:hypothetical protein
MGDKPPFRKPTDAEFAEAARQTGQDRYTRQRPQGGRVAALDKLHAQLVDDAQLYESEDSQDQRDAVAHALLAVADFLKAQGFSNPTLAPLMRPVAALVERENNSLDLVFTQRARVGRPKATLAEHERSGILAALAEAWLRTHGSDDRPQSGKLADAARKMKGRWFGIVTCAQLETARELVSQETKDHPAVRKARMFYGWYIKTVETFGVENAFPIMVRNLNDTKLPFGAGEGGILKTPGVSPTKDA